MVTVGDDHLAARLRGDLSRLQLCHHAAGPQTGAAAARQRPDVVIQPLHHRDKPGIGVFMGVAVIQAVDIRQQDQQIRPDAGRHHGGQSIVIPDADLLGGDGVVFVDDGQRPQLQQPLQGHVEILPPPSALGDVRPGDEQLGHRVVILGEQLVVRIHQLALAHGGGGLLGGNVLGPLRQVQLAEAHGNGAGGHQNDLMPGIFQVAHDLA